MRILTVVLTAGLLLIHAVDATGQSGQRPGSTAAGTVGGRNSNSNTLSTGSNTNTNANSNSQFLSGNNTGVNNGTLEVYSGADPYQGIILEGSTNLPQLPGVPSAPSNFSQPYKPEAFINTPVFLPAEITLAEAKECRNAKSTWYGGTRDDGAESIKLFYVKKTDSEASGLTMANYVGTVMATTSDGPFIAALCEAAYRAMRKGATAGVVDFSIRPKNTMFGLGFGASGGATGLPAAGAHPYAIAGTLGFGTGWSNQRVEGEVLLQLTALRGPVRPTAADSTVSPLAEPAAAATGEAPAPRRDSPSTEPYPAAAPHFMLMSSPVVSDARVSSSTPADERAQTAAYHSPKALAAVQRGQSKEQLFALFGAAFTKQHGKIVEVQGMRLRASGLSKKKTRLEIGDVSLADEDGRETPYWFLFEEDRLIAWGRPEQWSEAARSYRMNIQYPSEPRTLLFEANADRVPRR